MTPPPPPTQPQEPPSRRGAIGELSEIDIIQLFFRTELSSPKSLTCVLVPVYSGHVYTVTAQLCTSHDVTWKTRAVLSEG
jgi:hypothetical protein